MSFAARFGSIRAIKQGAGLKMSGFVETPEHGWRVHHLLERRAEVAPDFPFLHFADRDYTHAEMNCRANRMADRAL